MSAKDLLTRQAIEMDADTCSVLGSCMPHIKNQIPIHKSLVPPLDEYYSTPDRAYFDWMFAICTFFRLFGDRPFAGKDLTKELYPQMRTRQANAVIQATWYIGEQWDKSLLPSCVDAGKKAIWEVERAFSLLTGQPVTKQGLIDAWSKEAIDHVKIIEDHWDSVVLSELKPYSYVPLRESAPPSRPRSQHVVA